VQRQAYMVHLLVLSFVKCFIDHLLSTHPTYPPPCQCVNPHPRFCKNTHQCHHWSSFLQTGLSLFSHLQECPPWRLVLANGTTPTFMFVRTTSWGLILTLAYLQKMRNVTMVTFLVFVPGNGRGKQEQGWGQWADVQGTPAIVFFKSTDY